MSAGLFIGCSDDDNGVNQKVHGDWNMETYAAYMPELSQLEEGDVIWSIDLPTNTLYVENHVDEEYPVLLDSGTYELKLAGNLLTIYNYEEGYDRELKYRFEGDKLRLLEADPNIADGHQMLFNRRQGMEPHE